MTHPQPLVRDGINIATIATIIVREWIDELDVYGWQISKAAGRPLTPAEQELVRSTVGYLVDMLHAAIDRGTP